MHSLTRLIFLKKKKVVQELLLAFSKLVTALPNEQFPLLLERKMSNTNP